MKPRFSSKAVQLLAVMSLLMSLPAVAKQKAVYGEFVENTNGCINNEVFIHARSSGKSEKAKLTINIYREDICQDKPLLILDVKQAKLKKGEFILDNNLSKASLKGMVIITNRDTRETYRLRLNVSWKAVDGLILSKTKHDATELLSDESEYDQEDEFDLFERYKAAYRDASAQGTIEVNGELLTFGESRGAYLVTTNKSEYHVHDD